MYKSTIMNDSIYDPEELSDTKWNIVLCDPETLLVWYRLKWLDMEVVYELCRLSNRYLIPQIAMCVRTPANECKAIIKTRWIRWVQKRYRKRVAG